MHGKKPVKVAKYIVGEQQWKKCSDKAFSKAAGAKQLDAIAVVLESVEEGKYNCEVTVTEKPNLQATSLAEKSLKQVDDTCSKDDDASVQLLKESITTTDSTSIVMQSKESELLMFPCRRS
jgi:hypothetical protein